MSRLALDLRYALRQSARAPGFTVAAVLVLGVGIGFSTAIFSAVDHILLRPLDLPDSDRLVRICEDHPQEGCFSVSTANAADWADRATSLVAVGVARETGFRMQVGDEVIRVGGAFGTPGLFDALGVPAERGRLVQDDDLVPVGSGRVVVVSHGLWQDELGADPDALGRELVLDGEPHTVIGILPAGLEVPQMSWTPRLWLPPTFDPRAVENRSWRGFRGFGRLADGATAERAETELRAIQASLAEDYPDALRGWGARVTPMKEHVVGRARPLLLLFLGAVGAVLLIVSVNLASLLLARATTREHEFAVRAALGAERRALVGQLLVEAGVLAVLGGAVGVVVALWATGGFVALAPGSIPRIDEVMVDARVLAFATAVTAGVALVFGLAPVASLRRVGARGVLRERAGSGGRRGAGARRWLVAFELALALVLVLTAGLLTRSFATLSRWDPGFEVERLLTFQLYPPMERYGTRDDLVALYREARERFAAIPGVQAVGSASAGPLFGGSDGSTPFLVEGRPEVPIQDAPRVAWFDAGPGYFPTLGVPVIEGRNLAETDRRGEPTVALVNETMARRHWPDGSPIGASISLPQWETVVRVVGVVPDFQPFLPDDPVEPAIYVSNRQRPRGASFFVLRTDGDPTALASAVREAVAELDPEMEPAALSPLADHFRDQLVAPRFNMLLVALFALVALALGVAGIYAVMAYAVALRTREVGIRMALGADRDAILRSVIADGARIVAVGVVAGLAAALAVAGLLRGLLHGVAPTDPWALAGTTALLAGAALAAVLVPAVRATRTDPMEALRAE
jgi:putative ABC transport system permease protein